jgi:predicted nucleic acid-binding protein
VNAISTGEITLHRTPLEMLSHLSRSFPGLDEGEASCLILAKEKSWKIATDDGAAKKYIERDLNATYIVTTFNILAECVELGYLTREKALGLISTMENEANFVYNTEDYDDFKRSL